MFEICWENMDNHPQKKEEKTAEYRSVWGEEGSNQKCGKGERGEKSPRGPRFS